MSRRETVIYGVRAALALAKHRPGSIHRVLYLKALRKPLGPLLKATAANRRPYREVLVDDLNRVAGTPHHEGVAVIADPLPTHPFGPRREALLKARCLVAVDGVNNPHNLGAILRSMAWFGADALLTNDPRDVVNPAAIRVSQGGAELIPCIRCTDLGQALRTLTDGGVRVIGADQKARGSLDALAENRPTCIVFGSEAEGISQAVISACERRLSIPGSGDVESLNVGVAAGIMLAASRLTPKTPRT